MRSEITQVPAGSLSARLSYNFDDNGSHASAGKPAVVIKVGVKTREEFIAIALGQGTLPKRKSSRGAKRKIVATEITAHALDVTGNKTCFLESEMRSIALSLIIQFGAQYALAFMHGESDVHVVLINRTADGKALRSTFPNNATPRRVMVAVCDRLEREFNRGRRLLGKPLLKSVNEVRAEIDRKNGRKGMNLQIAERLSSENGSPNSIEDILSAMRALGWIAQRTKNRQVAVRFSEKKPTKNYDLDLVLRGVAQAFDLLQKLKLEQEQRKPMGKPKVPKTPKSASLFNGANTSKTPDLREATPADVAKWAERIAIHTKTPGLADQELVDALRGKAGVFLRFDGPDSVVIRDPENNGFLRIALTALRTAITVIRRKERDGPNPPEPGLEPSR